MTQHTDRIRDHYRAAIPDPDGMIARLASVLDGMEEPITAERLGA